MPSLHIQKPGGARLILRRAADGLPPGPAPASYGGFPSIANLTAIAPRITATRLGGEAPVSIQVHAADTTATFSDGGAAFEAEVGRAFDPYMDLEYTWDFGDADGGETLIHPVTGETVDLDTDQTGPEAAYVYREPGDYTVTLTARAWTGSGYVTGSTTTLRLDDMQVFDIRGGPTGGTYTLSLGGQTTTALTFDAKSKAIQAALEALSTVGAGNVECYGGVLSINHPLLIFFRGMRGGAPQSLLTANVSGLTGGTPVAHIDRGETGATSAAVAVAAWSGEDAYLDPTYDGSAGASDGTITRPYTTWAQLSSWVSQIDHRILLKRGTTLACTGEVTLTAGSRVAAYGTGARPVITWRGGGNIFLIELANSNNPLYPDPSGIILSDLAIHAGDTPGAKALQVLPSTNGDQTARRQICKHLAILDVAIDGGQGMGIQGGADVGFTIYRLTSTSEGETGQGMLVTTTRGFAVVGGSFTGGGGSIVYDHHIYSNVWTHALCRWIDFGAANARNYCVNSNVATYGSAYGGNDSYYHLFDGCDVKGVGNGFDFSNANNDIADSHMGRIIIQGNAIHTARDDAAVAHGVFAYNCGHVAFRDNDGWGDKLIMIRVGGDAQGYTARYRGDIYRNRYYCPEAMNAWEVGRHAGGWVHLNTLVSPAAFDTHNGIVNMYAANLAAWSLGENSYYTPNDATPFRNMTAAEWLGFAGWQALGLDEDSAAGVDPGWTDPANGDFT